MKNLSRMFLWLCLSIAIPLLTSCGSESPGVGEVGKQKDASPVAVIEVQGVSNELNKNNELLNKKYNERYFSSKRSI